MRNTGMTQIIRSVAARMSGTFSREDVFNAAGICVSKKKSFDHAWAHLRSSGEIVRCSVREYGHDEAFAPGIPGVKPKIFRAMHVKGAFCVSDISKLSEAHISYVQRMVQNLVLSEDLEFTGKRGKVKFYRVKNSEKFYLNYIKSV